MKTASEIVYQSCKSSVSLIDLEKMIKDYARQMIEQDRERVKASISEADSHLLKSQGYQLMRAIDETPITLQ